MRSRDLRSGNYGQRRPGNLRVLGIAAASVALVVGLTSSSGQLLQQEQPVHNPSGLPPPNPLANPKPDANGIMEYEMQRQQSRKRMEELNLLRQKEMTADTAKLLALANEVKTETSTKGDSISAVELHKVEMIEKLAHGVREKMRTTVN